MTAGLRTFTATRTTDGTTTIYTCPAGISYESVTVRYNLIRPLGSGIGLTTRLLINNVPFLGASLLYGGSTSNIINGSTLSLILAPGDTISLQTSGMSAGQTVTCDLFLSGYTVP